MVVSSPRYSLGDSQEGWRFRSGGCVKLLPNFAARSPGNWRRSAGHQSSTPENSTWKRSIRPWAYLAAPYSSSARPSGPEPATVGEPTGERYPCEDAGRVGIFAAQPLEVGIALGRGVVVGQEIVELVAEICVIGVGAARAYP